MSPVRGVKLSDYLAESRVVASMPSTSLMKALLQLADLIVRDGCTKDPLKFYDDLSSQASISIARVGGGKGSCDLSIHQVCSNAVRKMAAALAISVDGIRMRRNNTVHILVLIASPEGPASLNLVLISKLVSFLGQKERLEKLIASRSPAEIVACIGELETR